MGESHEAAPDGMPPVFEVVVWLPLLQTQRTVSPTLALKLEGEKEKFATVTMCFTAKEVVVNAMTDISTRA